MAIGSPIVATSIGGPAEIIRDGVDGLLVAPRRPDQLAAAISSLLSDPARCEAMAAAGRATAAGRFGQHHHAAAVTRLYARSSRRPERPKTQPGI